MKRVKCYADFIKSVISRIIACFTMHHDIMRNLLTKDGRARPTFICRETNKAHLLEMTLILGDQQ